MVENDTDKSKFTKTGLLNIARAVVKNGTVVTWSEYKETPATTSKEGVISGVFTLTLNKDSHPLVIVDDYIDGLQNIRGNLTQMDRMTQTYHALNSTTMETIPLLPSVGSWYFDERQIVLLEREDGSVWASSFLSKSVQANLSAKLGGYENSNVIQISGPQTKKLNAEYITFDKK